MNAFQFIGLLRMIYGKRPVDIEKIQKMGLLAVKIGQVHALRLDFLPAEKCAELSKLYRSTIPIKQEQVLKIVDRKAFRSIEMKPLASASVGQVHLATLKDGTPVAVKVVKQRFKKGFIRDVRSVRRLMRLAIFVYPKLASVFDPIGILEHIEEYTLRELDLRKEIEGHETLQDIFEQNKGGYDLGKLGFPKIYKHLSGEDVMVSDYVPGKTLDQLLTEKRLDYETLLELFHIHGFFLFNVGTFHGDLHPGNLILNDGRIFFVDTGAIGHASKRLREGLLNFFDALSEYDYKRCAHWLNRMAELRISGERYRKFERDFAELYKDFKDSTVAQVSLTRMMMQTIKLGVHAGMRFEHGMFPIIKSLMYLDGMVLRCNPDAVLLKDMRRFIREMREYDSR